MKKMSKGEVVLLSSIAAWVMVVNLTLIVLGIGHGWTVFFANIFFFLLGADIRRWKELLFGGLFGLFAAWLLVVSMGILAPALGALPAVAIPLTLIVFFMIVCGPVLPWICNNVAFGFLTIATINMETLVENTLPSMLVFVIGGTVMVGGSYLVLQFFTKKAAANAAK